MCGGARARARVRVCVCVCVCARARVLGSACILCKLIPYDIVVEVVGVPVRIVCKEMSCVDEQRKVSHQEPSVGWGHLHHFDFDQDVLLHTHTHTHTHTCLLYTSDAADER